MYILCKWNGSFIWSLLYTHIVFTVNISENHHRSMENNAGGMHRYMRVAQVSILSPFLHTAKYGAS